MYKKELLIFSNLRQVKEYIKNLKTEGFFATTISIQEFLNNYALCNKKRANQIEQIIAMNKACAKTKNYNKLNFSNDFLSFLKNKEYLFSFFSELATQKVSIDDLRNNDIYSFFDEYLDILEECLKHYKDELNKANLVDEITLTKLLPNYFLLNQYSKISFYLNGFIKKYELEFFEEISNLLEVKIIINISNYNKNLLKKSFKIDFEENFSYTLSFNKNWQIEQKQAIKYNDTLKSFSFSSAIYQYIYALYLISKHYDNNKNIAIILPDEKQAACLKALDIYNYLNIASGLNSNEIAQKINAIMNDDEYELSKNNIQEKLLKTKKKSLNFNNLNELKEQIINLSKDDEIKEILKNRMNDILLLNNEFKLQENEIINLLDINNIKISHKNGGNVSVLGLLESRGLKFDIAIVLDFNDDLIPKRSINEMFLNNAVRTKAGLISHLDRENLQRHYYKELFNSKEVFVLYLENEEKSPARMLKDYKLIEKKINTKDLITSFLNAKNGNIKANEQLLKIDKEEIKNHNFFEKELSFSRLNTYLNSPYEYYLKYIKNLNEPRSLENNNKASIGQLVHNFFENADFTNLKKDFNAKLKNLLSPIDFALIYNNLDEIQAYINTNSQSAKCEEKVYSKIANIDAYGIIDRLNNKTIIDYKTTQKPNSNKNHEKQLAFYALLLNNFELKSTLIYLKDTKQSIYECKNIKNLADEIIQNINTIKEQGFILDKAEKAYGYYHLIINKKEAK